jgi:hypothetical protein
MSSQFYGNVHFLGVARVAQGQGIVIASHAYNTETDLNGVKQALEQSTQSMSPGKHYSFTVANTSAWHLIAGKLTLPYLTLRAMLVYAHLYSFMRCCDVFKVLSVAYLSLAVTPTDHQYVYLILPSLTLH